MRRHEKGPLSARFVHEHFLDFRTDAGVGVSRALTFEHVVFDLDYGTNRFVIAEVEGHSDSYPDSLHAATLSNVQNHVNGVSGIFLNLLQFTLVVVS